MRAHVCDTGVRRKLLEQFDIADKSATRKAALEKIVTEDRVLRRPSSERCFESIDLVQSLAGEGAFAKEVLIDVRDLERVRVDAGMAGEELLEARSADPRGQRRRDAGLQDPVAFGDAAARAGHWSVQRVREGTDQLSHGAHGQDRVGVERQDKAHVSRRRHEVRINDERSVRRTAQQAVEFLQLPAFALPPHPPRLRRIPQPTSMEHVEARVTSRRSFRRVPIPAVELPDCRHGVVVLGAVVRHVFAVGIGPVGEQRKVDFARAARQMPRFELMDLFGDGLVCAKQYRHNDKRPH
jgi:hypothetical protein